MFTKNRLQQRLFIYLQHIYYKNVLEQFAKTLYFCQINAITNVQKYLLNHVLNQTEALFHFRFLQNPTNNEKQALAPFYHKNKPSKYSYVVISQKSQSCLWSINIKCKKYKCNLSVDVRMTASSLNAAYIIVIIIISSFITVTLCSPWVSNHS